MMWQLLTAAAGIHARGVIHRDIKPQNILVADDLSAVKLCDFGLAIRASNLPPTLDMPGSLDARVDAWSLGCVMASVVTGRSVFNALNDPPDEELFAILRVLGVPDEDAWPGFLDTPFAVSWMPKLDLRQPSVMRDIVPETALSDQGFQVLSGLLVCNPERRLTAADALKLPWFAHQDARETTLLVPNKAQALLAL
ncbi:hypothetical protein PR202_ga12847 [Eleusine coracana subsp. coracana]|uniref:[RNA-polymerase]-subunit kinase n=1 Tax=Eleusine coracana subsp. coracana TaxID=191504 RepID=A0AAV5CD50_ELECO|nr:hypothetical protein PR202_ga12847 [Eleusine coracana subsp. coracana]